MAEPLKENLPELQKAASFSEEASVAARAASFSFRRGVGALSHFGGIWLGISTLAETAISQWDHHVEKKRITCEFDDEIAAGLGKRPADIKISDMEQAAKENPVIGDALERSTKRRNLSVAVTVGAAAAALLIIAPAAGAAALAIIPALATHALTHSLIVGGITALGFLGAEKTLEKVGEKKLHLEEPSLHKVEHHPEKQAELSVSSQVTLLAHLQSKHKQVTQEQVMTLLASAQPGLNKQIEADFGRPFEKLGTNDKRQAIERYGAQFDVAGLTADINANHIRAQELAFIAYGQASGVAPKGSSRVTQMEREAASLNAQIAAEAPETNKDASRPKLAFARAQVSITAPKQQKAEETAWRRRIEAQRREQQTAVGVA